MFGAGRLLISRAICRTREIVAYSLCSKCRSIRTSSYLEHLQAPRFACYATPFWTSPQAGRHLSLVTANCKPKKPENGEKSGLIAENLVDDFTDDAASSRLRVKRQRSPREAQELRFARQIETLVKEGKVEEAHEVFKGLKKARVQPNVFMFNNLIAGYKRERDVQTCFKLFNEVSIGFCVCVGGGGGAIDKFFF